MENLIDWKVLERHAAASIPALEKVVRETYNAQHVSLHSSGTDRGIEFYVVDSCGLHFRLVCGEAEDTEHPCGEKPYIFMSEKAQRELEVNRDGKAVLDAIRERMKHGHEAVPADWEFFFKGVTFYVFEAEGDRKGWDVMLSDEWNAVSQNLGIVTGPLVKIEMTGYDMHLIGVDQEQYELGPDCPMCENPCESDEPLIEVEDPADEEQPVKDHPGCYLQHCIEKQGVRVIAYKVSEEE